MSIPEHVAIIPDGNRRWAKAKGLAAFDGHYRGFEAAREISRYAAERGVKYLSLWGMSIENFSKRSRLEVAGLLRIFEKMFRDILEDEDTFTKKVRVQVFGRWREKFPKKLVKTIEEVVEVTAKHDKSYLNLFLVYNGTDEMLGAIQGMVDKARPAPTPGEESSSTPGEVARRITPKILKQHLMTRDLPPVDLLIRTAGEPHLSAGFMMWDVADAELYFPEVFWPDFTPAEFDKALEFYAKRERRFGK
jgi:undecaprenyl diphosphate synthase